MRELIRYDVFFNPYYGKTESYVVIQTRIRDGVFGLRMDSRTKFAEFDNAEEADKHCRELNGHDVA